MDQSTGKEMAMKCVETGSVNPAAIQEVEILHREITLYKTLKHERIVNYYGSVQDHKSLSIFMEYMEGVGASSVFICFSYRELSREQDVVLICFPLSIGLIISSSLLCIVSEF